MRVLQPVVDVRLITFHCTLNDINIYFFFGEQDMQFFNKFFKFHVSATI